MPPWDPSRPNLPCLRRSRKPRSSPSADTRSCRSTSFKAYPIGYFHLDIAEVRTEQGKLHLFVAIDRTSKLAFAQLHEKATHQVAADFLNTLADSDQGDAEDTQIPWRICQQARTGRVHAFGYACDKHGIEHRLTRPYYPWTNGQVERMNRTLKEATVRRYHYASHDELRAHIRLFLDVYNHARRLKALRGLTPYEFTCRHGPKNQTGSGSTRHTTPRG